MEIVAAFLGGVAICQLAYAISINRIAILCSEGGGAGPIDRNRIHALISKIAKVSALRPRRDFLTIEEIKESVLSATDDWEIQMERFIKELGEK